jgi:hypothetical protein
MQGLLNEEAHRQLVISARDGRTQSCCKFCIHTHWHVSAAGMNTMRVWGKCADQTLAWTKSLNPRPVRWRRISPGRLVRHVR